MNNLIYNNKTLLIAISVLIIASGAILTYLQYNIEPWETVGGFLCGLGLGLLLIFISLKKPLD
ncbi:MAG: hypothetical protein HKP48_06915 [Winogradskyella sp.]|uniref:hypothetical protein n=1 Tax=Winogradskyella sp. TaxID=1883156 RepID=UPI0017E0E534|nr:hypothetical protein [Winogradskyella sp.]MBT8246077.1 hypothetical protein [Winogradskyella sp.]NNK23019.1 hypothetical protein [Winogradskyella sp.]